MSTAEYRELAKRAESGDFEAVQTVPFFEILPWIMENPLSKRLPKSFRFGKRRQGRASINVYCEAWEDLMRAFPALSTDYNWNAVQQAFDLRDELNAD